MIESWDKFLDEFNERTDSLKSKLNVTIYGSYYPNKEKTLLKNLKDFLIKNGYTNTILVEDKQRPGDDPLEISQKCMQFSQINLLIFTRAGKRYGLIDELAFLTSNTQMFEKVPFSIVFDQVRGGKSSIPALSRSRINIFDVKLREFKSTQELETILLIEIYWIMRKWVRRYGYEN